MTSIKSRLFNFLIRNRHLFRGKLHKEVFDLNTSILQFREQCEKAAARNSTLPPGLSIRKEIIDGLKAEWLVPEGADTAKVILYMHGGGYVSGSCNDHRTIVARFAHYTGFSNLLYEYRVAPEHPFPAALDDSMTVYRHLLDKGVKPQNILFAGESAGGGLCLATLLALKDQNLPLPVAAVAISPWTDLTCSGNSYKTKNKVSVAQMNSWHVFSHHYAGSNDPAHHLISPLFGDLKGLPPLFINSGEDDELFDDGERFYQRALEAGVEASFRAGKGMIHCYPLMAPVFREATVAMTEIVDFVKKNLQSGIKL